jgi:beta-fructofuranosidase
MLRLKDKWVWDFWFARDGADYHVFYLQADNRLAKEYFRHFNPTVGHAVSQDLKNWTILPDAIAPSLEAQRWDNYTTWTGSVIQHSGAWYMFYTGSTREERAWIQRVGVAKSQDLIHWEKCGTEPLMEAVPQWYEKLDLSLWHDEAWRDPFVFKHPDTGKFHAFITARVNYGAPDGRGVIAQAVSDDLFNWTVQEPLTIPGEFGQMEVPQVCKIGPLYYLLFCTGAGHYSAVRRQRPGIKLVTGTHYLVSENIMGSYRYLDETDFFAGDEAASLYAGKLIQAPDGQWCFMAFRHNDADGEFIGDIIDPMPVDVLADGRLQLRR